MPLALTTSRTGCNQQQGRGCERHGQWYGWLSSSYRATVTAAGTFPDCWGGLMQLTQLRLSDTSIGGKQ
jgi:hypothetical protein